MSVFTTKSFKRLQARWYRKLEAADFVDIERRQGSVLGDLNERTHFRAGIVEVTVDYYDWAQAKLFEGRFRQPRDARGRFKGPSHRLVWELHCQGLSNAEIGRKLGRDRWLAEDLVKEIRRYLGG